MDLERSLALPAPSASSLPVGMVGSRADGIVQGAAWRPMEMSALPRARGVWCRTVLPAHLVFHLLRPAEVWQLTVAQCSLSLCGRGLHHVLFLLHKELWAGLLLGGQGCISHVLWGPAGTCVCFPWSRRVCSSHWGQGRVKAGSRGCFQWAPERLGRDPQALMLETGRTGL